MVEGKIVSAEQLSEILNVPKSWVYVKARAKKDPLPHMKFGKYLRFNLDEVMTALKTNDK